MIFTLPALVIRLVNDTARASPVAAVGVCLDHRSDRKLAWVPIGQFQSFPGGLPENERVKNSPARITLVKEVLARLKPLTW